MRRLRPDPVELQGGNQTDNTARHSLSRFHQRLVLIAIELRRSVEPATELPNLILTHQPTEILARVASRDEVARTKHPQATGMIASGLKTSHNVTFPFHL